jgi:hypothetical protein
VPVDAVRRQAPRVDLRRIRWIGLAPRGGQGRVWVLDAWATSAGVPPAPTAGRVSVILAGGSATWSGGRFRIRLTVTSQTDVPRPTVVAYNVYPYETSGWRKRGTITLPAGRRRVRTTLVVPAKRTDSRLVVATYPNRWGVNLTDYVWLPVR